MLVPIQAPCFSSNCKRHIPLKPKKKKKKEEGEFRQNVIYQLLTFITSITGSAQPLIIVF